MLATPLTREDVEGVYAGLRPLLAGESESTSKLSREHVVAHPVPGLVVVAGGKYTTYRVMAKDAVDEAARALDFRVAAELHRRGPAARAPRATRPPGTAGHRIGGPRPACTWRGSSTCCSRYGVHDRRGARAVIDRPRAGRAAAGRRRLPRRRGRLRRPARGRPAPGRRPDPPHPDLDRDLGPRVSDRAGSRAADGRRAGLERGAARARSPALPGPGRGRTRLARSSRTTSPPTPPASAPRRSSRCADAGDRGIPGRSDRVKEIAARAEG